MKKVIFSFLILGLCAIAISCNGQPKKTKIAYIGNTQDQPFYKSLTNGIKKELAKRDVTVDFFSATHQKDFASQEEFITQVIQKKYSAVIIYPVDFQKMISSIAKLEQAKIPYVFIDTAIDPNDLTMRLQYNCGYVATDNLLVGKEAFQLIQSQKAKSVLLVRGVPEHRSSSDREDGFLSEMKNQNPHIRATIITGDWDTNQAYQEMKKLSGSKKLDFDAIFAFDDDMALGIAKFYKEKKLQRPYIVSVDGSELGQKGLLEGDIDAIIVQATELMGTEALHRAISCLEDSQKSPINTMTPSILMKKSQSLEQNEK